MSDNDYQPNPDPLNDDDDERICTFEEWLTLLFDYPPVSLQEYWELYSARSIDMGCTFDYDYGVEYYIRLFDNLPTHLAPYNPHQIGQGLSSLIGYDFAWMLAEDAAPIEQRKQAFRLMYNVYEQVFEPHCEWGVKNELNSVCFIWWDMGLPIFNENEREPDPDSMNGTAIGVMERVLANLTNPACWESALHGLGHYQRFDPPRIRAAIDGFIAKHPDLDPRLREYANAARYGAVL